MNIDFNDDYKIAKVLFIDKELDRLPNLHRGNNSYSRVVRLYDNNGKVIKTYTQNREKNYKYGEIADRRKRYQLLKKQLMSELKVSPTEYNIQLSAAYRLTKEDWDKMKSQSNPKKIKGDLWFENIHMRSRFEVNTAIVLKKLNLEFKYEPEIILDGIIVHPDFVVYLPEFEVCFIIECMGMTGSSGYDWDAINRMKLLMDVGCIPFRDFLVLGGTETFIPTEEWVANAIISMVNSIAAECVQPLSRQIVSHAKRSLISELPPEIAERIAQEWK